MRIISWAQEKLQYLLREIGEKRKKGIDEAQNNVALGPNALCSPAKAGPEKLPAIPSMDDDEMMTSTTRC